MAHLIDKSALVAEIEKRIKWYEEIGTYLSPKGTLTNLLCYINTLEVKECDNIWHDASETPKGAGDKEILVQFADSHASVFEIDDWEYLDHQTKWAYLKDLT